MATGGGRQLAAQHSHSLEGWFAHIPGIKVVVPAVPADARGLLLAALADPDPVFVFEPATLYPVEGEVDVDAGPGEIGRALVRREGDAVSLVTYGGSLGKALEAADRLAVDGIAAEVVDLRSLRPLDTETILGSVARTHRAVIVDEAWRTASIAAEVSARIMEGGFYTLDVPVARVCGAEVPMPYAKHMEEAALPQVPTIVGAVRELLGRG
jgi:pyruvate/2-oxoglutarate/acetoin dehydrogenase E1 component